ncbi:MAG: putative DNA binding domain-containing protein [Defluviitaleaceae bacterium]|nr:putative DNA binding domain-containing protein [Defluviitaleaceae bacterium]MCL2263942.1 putative DNA binding domain-containing protein [Defluviitaleaceae bacterium]
MTRITEATECDFKLAVEKEKPISWLKSVSAFANGIGGTLFFGVNNGGNAIGLTDPQADADFISNRIKDRIAPIPEFTLTPHIENGKNILALAIKSGQNTPYYYTPSKDTKRAYVRIGNESVLAPDYMLNELILKGGNRTYDIIPTNFKKEDYSFSLLEATYRHRTKSRFQPSDYVSFGLATDEGYLTRAGSLLADQPIVYNARLFCTRWQGLHKGSIFDDAIDDKEYEGNLIHLLENGCNFVKLHNRMGFAKEPMERVEKPDYADRAVMEAIVNAIIHRDWLMQGSEVHIDIFDDRLEISSPGGMWSGKMIQEEDINNLKSERRNPVIADLFHRMKYMERRGSGLRKIVEETKKLHGFTNTYMPTFHSSRSDFTVVLKNMNYTNEFGIKFGTKFGGKINRTQKEIIEQMTTHPEINAQEIANTIGITKRAIEKNISILNKLGLIKHVGSTKNGKWLVNNTTS